MEKTKFLKLINKLREEGACPDTLDSIEERYFFSLTVNESQRDDITFLESELKKFRLMADWSPCTISWIKDDLTYAGVNKTFCNVFNKLEEEFIGEEIGSHTNQPFLRKFSEDLFNHSDISHSIEVESDIEDEVKKFYLVGTKFNGGKEAIIMGLDVTEISQLKQSVALMERLSSLGEMVAGIVHEINNPLTVVKNRAMMIPKYLDKGNHQKIVDSSQTISDTCDKMVKIIEGIKTFVRQGHRDPYSEAFVFDVMDEAKLLLETKLREADVKLELPSERDGVLIFGNQTQIYQVFINLISNSIDAIRDQGERWIKVSIDHESDGYVAIRFKDSGRGIPKEIQKRIFESFYTTKSQGKGTGLGLSLCKKIIEDHGGELLLDDSDQNTCFVISLPAAENTVKKAG